MQPWQERYRDKLVPVDDALRVIKPGDTVVIGINGNIPSFLCRALGERLEAWPELHLLGAGLLERFAFHEPQVAARYTVQDMFLTAATRPAMQQRAIDFLPFNTALWPSDVRQGLRTVNVFLTSVSPPDEHGYCSFGFMLWASADLVEVAKVVIAEVDESHIVTYGDNYVHVSQLDYLVEKPEATTFGDVATTMGFSAPDAVDRQIAAHAAELIHDGDTFQLGAGTVSMAVIEHLRQKNDLGFHSEICPTGVAQLIAAGNINGAYKTLNPRKAVCTALWGDEFTLDFAHLNPAIELKRMSYTNNPRIIAQHDNMVAINTALSVDLTGQVAVESFGAGHVFRGGGPAGVHHRRLAGQKWPRRHRAALDRPRRDGEPHRAAAPRRHGGQRAAHVRQLRGDRVRRRQLAGQVPARAGRAAHLHCPPRLSPRAAPCGAAPVLAVRSKALPCGTLKSKENGVSAVGILANPAAGRDIRRLVAAGSVVSNREKVQIVRRVLLGLDALGVETVLTMPDAFAICRQAQQGLRLRACVVEVPLAAEFTALDTTRAAALMAAQGVGCLVSLGGDGTCRAVAKGCGNVPLLPLSTGTNNVFPYALEGTLAGLAAGLVARALVPPEAVIEQRPRLDVIRNGTAAELAVVDVVFCTQPFVGARAVWDVRTVRTVVVAQRRPAQLGFAALAGNFPADGAGGMLLELDPDAPPVLAPIAPGMVVPVGVRRAVPLPPGAEVTLAAGAGTLALDGEREVEVSPHDRIVVRLNPHGPRVINPWRVLELAAQEGVFVRLPGLGKPAGTDEAEAQ